MRRIAYALACLATLLLHGLAEAGEVRIKDITNPEGARNNQLYGFGLVVGLAGTGSRSLFTQEVAVDMLQRLNTRGTIYSVLPSDALFQSTNISAVMVTAEIGPYSRKGTRLDVIVSSLDDATSIQGGTLLFTPLRGADGDVYAVAQGPLSIGGFAVQGVAAKVQKNHPTAGRVTDGAIVEKEALGEVICKGQLHLLLRDADYNTARLIAKVINERFPCNAMAIDAATVAVMLPPDRCTNPMAFVSEIGLLTVTPDSPARVVINERTGTVVAGDQVKVSATAVAQGNLSIVAVETPEVSQPEAFSRGRTTVVPRTQVDATEGRSRLIVVAQTVTVADLARALNALGVTPRDLIAIFQALKLAGALHAELVIM
jgi:flagellar P-ring protein precursor FlgI